MPPAARLPLLPPVLAAVLTAVAAFWGITSPQFWYDEAATILAVDRPLGELPDLLQKVDAVHGLYYVLMNPWVAVFGTSELAMRAPSALALTAAAPLVSSIAMHHASRWSTPRTWSAGIIAAILFAVLPGVSWTGQEARGYAMAVLASAAALWCFERHREHRGLWSLAGFVVLQAAAIGFSLYSAAIVVLYALRALSWGRRDAARVLAACAAVGVLVLPLALTALAQSGQVSWISLSSGQMLERMAVRTFFVSPMNRGGHLGELSLQIAPWLLGLVVVILAAALIRGPGRRQILWLLGAVALPLVAVIGARAAGMQLFQERYFTFSAPFLVIAVALALAGIRWHALSAAAAAVLVLLSLPSLAGQNTPDAKIGDRFADAASLISRADTALFLDPPARATLQVYPLRQGIADPLLHQDGIEADNIWGWNRPDLDPTEIVPQGSTAVVSYKSSPEHDPVLENLSDHGCEIDFSDRRTRYRITLLECPAP